MKTADKLALNIHADLGSGSPVLLIHGVEDSGKFWEPIDMKLSKNKRVISVDLLGFGGSPMSPSGTYTLDENIEALENTLLPLNITGPITIVGHSMGTFVALEYAHRHPERVSKIILTSPVFIFREGPLRYKRLPELLQQWFLSKTNILRSAYLKRNGIKLLPSILSVDNIVGKQRPLTQLENLGQTPIYILYGYYDSLVINSNIHYLKKNFPNIHVQSFKRFHDIPHTEMASLIEKIEYNKPN
jgi:pimeloyl-ACP methyl ester carboxylesterase